MSSCRDEAHEHDHHDHGHGHSHGGGHSHSHEDPERGQEYSLYQHIDIDKVRCLNEVEEGSAKALFRPWHLRTDKSKFVQSDADEQLIIIVPFCGEVLLKSIMVIGENDASHPRTMRVFKNLAHADFDEMERLTPTQEFNLVQDPLGTLEYQTRIAQFQGIHSLTLFFPNNFGADATKIHYIGFKGEFKKMKREAVIAIYESSPVPGSYKTETQQEHQTLM